MEFTPMKQTRLNTAKTTLTLIGFTVFLLTILALGSCKKKIESDPQLDYMSFTLTNLGGGPLVDPTTQLSRGDNYRLIITPASGVIPATANYTITHVPTAAITLDVTRTNSVDFTVNNTPDTRVTVTVTHKTDSSVSESITLTLAPQSGYMRFTLTNASGAIVTTTTPLSRGNTYGLVITPASGTTIPTADYVVTHIPIAAITTNVIRTNSVDFTVNNTVDTSVTFTVTHRTDSSVSESVTLNLASQVVTTFQQDIENANTVPNFIIANALTREVLEPLGATADATLEKRYVTESGGSGTQDGSSWANAWAATDLRNNINAISDATANKVYLIMVAGGSYTPGATRTVSFGMKDRVAIMGGFQTGGGWGRTGTTIFSGDIGAVGSINDNSYLVFSHNSLTLNNAHLYGVTIANGNANGSFPQNAGGGMHNNGSSPVLTEVIFSGNTASAGGGMYNTGSSPVLTKVVFSGNSATATGTVGGGGMLNVASSSPVLTRVVFSRNSTANNGGGMYSSGSSSVLTEVVFISNTADNGGGMYNENLSSPVMTSVVFSGNSSTRSESLGGGGGGMYNLSSSPVMVGSVFRNNSSVGNGGGMLNNNGTAAGPLIVNTIFSGNTLSGTGRGPDIAVNLGNPGTENIRIAGSVLGIGGGSPINGIVSFNSGIRTISHHSLTSGVVNFGADANLTVNGMNFPYPTITGGSAVNLGLFVRKHVNGTATTYYFSETGTGTSWYTGFTSTGAGGLVAPAVDLPTTGTIEDLTATDIAGNARNARPDAGVYELP